MKVWKKCRSLIYNRIKNIRVISDSSGVVINEHRKKR